MSIANPASTAKENAAAYIASLLAILGDRDPLAVLAATPASAAAAVAGIPENDLRRPEVPGKWSLVQVLQHLADAELVGAYRMRMIAAHEEPEIQGYDQDLWANRLRSAEAHAADALALFSVLRAANLRLVRALSPAELDRAGRHAERGRETIRRMLHLYAGHDLVHLRQLERIKRALDGNRAH